MSQSKSLGLPWEGRGANRSCHLRVPARRFESSVGLGALERVFSHQQTEKEVTAAFRVPAFSSIYGKSGLLKMVISRKQRENKSRQQTVLEVGLLGPNANTRVTGIRSMEL